MTTEVALFTIRNKTSYASKTNFIDIVLMHFAAAVEAASANNLGAVRLVRNATLGGVPAYADINTTNSVVEIDIAGTTVANGSELFEVDLAGKNDEDSEFLGELRIILHPGDTITMAVSSANSATFDGSLIWRELF